MKKITINLPISVCVAVEQIATNKKMTFDEAFIFLINGVVSPCKH